MVIAAFEHLRKKIELQNEQIKAAKIKEEQAKKVRSSTLELAVPLLVVL